MDRRRFLLTSLAGALAVPLAVEAQAVKPLRIGLLAPGPVSCPVTKMTNAFRKGLVDAGYTEGQDIVLDRRCFEAMETASDVLNGLLRAKPDILVAAGNPAAIAMRDGVRGVPIVFVNTADPVASQMTQSIGRPNANMTGLTDLTITLNAKRLQVLKEALPSMRLLALLSATGDPSINAFRRDLDTAASAIGVRVRHVAVARPQELPTAFEAMKTARVDAFLVMQTALFWTERGRLAEASLKHGIPGMYPYGSFVRDGGLMSYGADEEEMYRRAAGFVAKILKGAKPSDLPVEQPTKFELIINLKTAKALSLTIPPSVLARADQVIE